MTDQEQNPDQQDEPLKTAMQESVQNLQRTSSSNKPVFKYKTNRFDVAVWKNDRGYSVSLRKSFKKQGDPDVTRIKISFFPDEIDSVIAILIKSKEFLQKKGVKTYRAEQE